MESKTDTNAKATGSQDVGATANQGDANAQTGVTKTDDKKSKESDDQFDIEKLDPRVKKIIQDLRKENGDHRIKNKTLADGHEKLKRALVEAGIVEDDEEGPEEKLKAISTEYQNATVKNAVLATALEYGVGKDDYKYFEYLVADKLASLEDDQELTDDDLAELATEARGRSGNISGGGTTSVDSSSSKGKKPGVSDDITLDQFAQMNITEKSKLFQKNPDLYNRLFSEAKAKKLILK